MKISPRNTRATPPKKDGSQEMAARSRWISTSTNPLGKHDHLGAFVPHRRLERRRQAALQHTAGDGAAAH